MQKELNALEQRWGLALQSASFGVWDLDPVAQRVHYSPEWKAELGYAVNDEPEPTAVWRSRVHPEDLDTMVAELGRHLDGQTEAYTFEFRLRAADGRYRWVLSRGRVAARDPQGRALRVVGTLTDLSDRREIEALRAERDRVAAASQAKTEFLARMSHELRTPLNAVLGFAQLLKQSLGQGEPEAQRHQVALIETQRHQVLQIEQAGWHLLGMINDVLDLSRVQNGQLALQLEPVPLAPAWQAACETLAPLAAAMGVQVLPPELSAGATVHADPARLRQVLGHLLGNALKYNRRSGQVQLHAALTAGPDGIACWQLQLQDTGIGISAVQMDHLFEPFNRLGRQAPSTDGSPMADGVGVGLALTRWLVQAMGGHIALASVEGQGTTVTLHLPAAPG